jgi:glucose/arabinose dehydrogenase
MSNPLGSRKPSRSCWRPLLETLEERLTPSNYPDGFGEILVAGGLSRPTAMEFAPDGRLFVAEQGGNLRVIKNGTLLPTPFVSLAVNSDGERGLLGVTFDPDFAANQFIYVYYTTAASPVHNRVSRFTAAGDVAAPGSEAVLLDLNPLGAPNHNGGAIHFGADGKLYVGAGENAVPSNSQTLGNLLGKVLRLNADGSIPPDNPFYNQATGVNRAIWALGLRNPFTFAVQPGTGRMFINDVGQDSWEEIDNAMAGANYGWPATEGFFDQGQFPQYTEPVFAYGHGPGDTTGCAIVGGTFYDPAANPFPADYAGTYFFQDLCNGWIRRLNPADGSVTGFATGLPANLVDLKVDAAGSLYYLAEGSGASTGVVYRVDYVSPLNQGYVTALYQDLLGRPVDPGALAYWTGLLNRGTPRAQVVLAIEGSLEYRRLVVQGLYQELLGRPAEDAARDYWAGILGQGGTAEQVEAVVLSSPEYVARRGGGSVAGFLQALYLDVLGRDIDPAGAQTWSQALAGGATPTQVAAAVLASPESDGREVRGLFNRFLHRDPDPGARGYFVGLLQRGVSNEQVLAIILASDEYFAGP